MTGKKVPLHWGHSSDPADIIGHIDPATVEAIDHEVVAEGWVDQSIDRGREVWRLAKAGVLSFSFGYLVTASRKLADGVRVITRLDVFEISAVAAPMNNDTRVVETKALDDMEQRVRREERAYWRRLLAGEDPTKDDTKAATAQRKARGPVQIATFEC